MDTPLIVQSQAPVPATAEVREAVLHAAIIREAAQGWRVQAQSPIQASLVKGKPTSHVLHLLLSLITVGFWIPVWIFIALCGGQRSKVITVDRFGVLR